MTPSSLTLKYSLTEIDSLAQILSEFLARRVAETGGFHVALGGELGAGKTTLVQSLLRLLGVQEEITSPSYVLCHEYALPANAIKMIEHWDVYRLGGVPEELWEPLSSDGLRLVEWASKFPELFNAMNLSLHLRFVGDGKDERFLDIASDREEDISALVKDFSDWRV